MKKPDKRKLSHRLAMMTLEIAKDELPPGESRIFAARPLTSLGTSGRPIATEFKV